MYSNEILVKITKEMFDRAGVEYKAFNKDKNFTKEEVRTASEEIGKILKKFSN